MKCLNDISVYGYIEEEKSKETEWLSREGEEHIRRYQENQGQTEFKMAEWLTRKKCLCEGREDHDRKADSEFDRTELFFLIFFFLL